jgi:hypothetical protein
MGGYGLVAIPSQTSPTRGRELEPQFRGVIPNQIQNQRDGVISSRYIGSPSVFSLHSPIALAFALADCRIIECRNEVTRRGQGGER